MKTFLFVLVLMCAVGAICIAADMAMAPDHGVTDPAKIQWGACPDGLPAGCKMAVLQGDPGKSGEEFTVRALFPNGYQIMPHFHPTQENLTIISGRFHVGMGDKFDKAATQPLPAGGFGYMGPKMHHFAYAEGDTIVQIHAIGPFAITYVNAADDPRTAKK
jgi:hypothetical protein